MSSPGEVKSQVHHVQDDLGGLRGVHNAAEVQEAIDGAEIDALRSREAMRMNDGFGSFTENLERLVRENNRNSIIRVFHWAREFFGNRASKSKPGVVTGSAARVRSFSEILSQKQVQETIRVVETPVERINPLAHATLVAYQQHVAAMPQAPQVMVQSAAMFSPVTGMPAGLMGIHF